MQERGITPDCGEVVPASANVVVQRNASYLFGAGLIDAIPDQQIIDRATAEQVENGARAGRE